MYSHRQLSFKTTPDDHLKPLARSPNVNKLVSCDLCIQPKGENGNTASQLIVKIVLTATEDELLKAASSIIPPTSKISPTVITTLL